MQLQDLEEYRLFRKDIFNFLDDRDWFIKCMSWNFYSIGEDYGCIPIISKRRMGDAYDYWKTDVERTLKLGIQEETIQLDHFKHASFIAFWLRRTLPINELRLIQTLAKRSSESIRKNQREFLKYGSEICSLLIGFKVCLYFEIDQTYMDENGTIQPIVEDRKSYLEKCRLEPSTIHEYTMIMKHKNMSPHAIYLLYKSLFTNILAGSQTRE